MPENKHAIQCRIYCEDAARGFVPCPGILQEVVWPKSDEGDGVRIDGWVSTRVFIRLGCHAYIPSSILTTLLSTQSPGLPRHPNNTLLRPPRRQTHRLLHLLHLHPRPRHHPPKHSNRPVPNPPPRPPKQPPLPLHRPLLPHLPRGQRTNHHPRHLPLHAARTVDH